MEFEEIIAPTIKELFLERMESMIISGKLKPGDILPTEREIASSMKISKTVVHEGITELKRLGFVNVASRKGVTVADYAQLGNLDTLIAIMNYHSGQLDEKTACSLLDLRAYIEKPAFLMLCKKHTDKDLEILQQKIDAIKKSVPKGIREMAMELFQYHRTICFLSGNTITPLLINGVLAPCLVFWQDWIRLLGEQACIAQAEKFYELIAAGKGEESCNLLEEGIVYFKKNKGYL